LLYPDKAKTGEQQSFGAPAVFNTSASLGKQLALVMLLSTECAVFSWGPWASRGPSATSETRVCY